jgi:cytochrome c
VKIVKSKGKGWIKYKWFHPKTKRIEPKLGYVQRVDNSWWIGSGIYVSN